MFKNLVGGPTCRKQWTQDYDPGCPVLEAAFETTILFIHLVTSKLSSYVMETKKKINVKPQTKLKKLAMSREKTFAMHVTYRGLASGTLK